MRDINTKIEGMPWPKTGATHYHAQDFSDEGRAIKGLVVEALGD